MEDCLLTNDFSNSQWHMERNLIYISSSKYRSTVGYITYVESVTGVLIGCRTNELVCSYTSPSRRCTTHAKSPRIFQLSTLLLFHFPLLSRLTRLILPFRYPLLSCCSFLSIYEAVDEKKREKCLRSVWYLRIRKKVSSFPFPPISPKLSFSVCTDFSPSRSILALTLEFTRDKKYNR